MLSPTGFRSTVVSRKRDAAERSAKLAERQPSFTGGLYGQRRFPADHRPPPLAGLSGGPPGCEHCADGEPANATAAVAIQFPATAHEAEPANFCAATARLTFRNYPTQRNSPGCIFAATFDCEGIAADEDSGNSG